MVSIPFTDVAAMTSDAWPAISRGYLECLLSGRYVGGSPIAAFERSWAEYCGAGHAVGVASGTSALQLALVALGIAPGDEVIVPANTFIATAAAVVHAGAIPRFADVSEETLLLTPATLRAAITPRTRAVIVVHLYGQVPDMAGLQAVAGEREILLVEDAAQAHGAEWAGRRAGSFGAAAAFSFYPGKNLGAFGDAGAVVTSRPEVADRVRALANHGRVNGRAHYQHELLGWNSRLDALQAIALSGKLPLLEEWTRRRITLADRYRAQLADLDLGLVETSPLARHVYHLFVIRVAERAQVCAQLASRGIQTGIHYPVPCHQQPPLLRYADGPLPVVERAAAQALSLPLFPHMTTAQVDTVCEALAGILAAGSGARASGGPLRARQSGASGGAIPAQAAAGDVAGAARRSRARAGIGRGQEGAKRVLDVAVSATAIVVLAPLLVLLWCLVRWTSPGPALFSQERLGRNRQPFTMLKFRTMHAGSDDQIHRDYVASLLRDERARPGERSGLFKLDDDPRVTRLGRWLRRSSLDELPQLFNVLRGDMSLVGPRPVLPWEAEIFPGQYQQRFLVKAGMTGLWQVSGRNRLTAREGLELDVEYARTHSLVRDIVILASTLPALFRGGAA